MIVLHQHLRILILSKFTHQYAFARALDLPDQYISTTLRGRRLLRKEEASRWQKALGCEWQDLAPVLRVERDSEVA